MFTPVFSTGSGRKISTLCLSFCLVRSVPTTPGLPNQTWGSSVCAIVTLSLYRKRKYHGISKTLEEEKKKDVLGARLAYERLCPSEMGRAGQGSEEEEPKGANYASAIPTLTSAPHLSGRLGVSRSP